MTIVGVFVGGASSRMGRPKGLLEHPSGGTLLEHIVGAVTEASYACVLVGEASAYAGLVPHVPRLADHVRGIGPIGGLSALLAEPHEHAISVACDMPFVDAAVLRTLATDARAGCVAAWNEDAAMFEPMLARWHTPTARSAVAEAIAAHRYSLAKLLAGLGAHPCLASAATVDWDTPEDVGRTR